MISCSLSAHIVDGFFVFSTCFAMYLFGVLSSLAVLIYSLCVCVVVIYVL